MSRRSLLLAAAGAAAGAALAPSRALAGAPAGALRVSSLDVGPLGPAGRVVMLPAGVQLVGLQTGGAGPLPARARVRLRSGLWGPWVSAAAAGHGPEQTAAGAARTGEPLWVGGGARELQLRSAEPLERARLRLVTAPRGEPFGIVPGRAGAAALRLAQPVLAAGAGQPPIIARAAWARATQLPRVAPEYGEVKMAFVHHTENPNGYTAGEVPAMLRAIYAFHRDVNGWNDIGYNFVVDLFGRVFEARAGGVDEPVVGAHAGGYNLESTGIAVLGSFSGTPISAAARSTLQRLLAWKLALHGAATQGRVQVRVNPAGAVYSKYPARARVSLPRIAGHRDADSTDCPGNTLYGELPRVRRAVASLTGRAVIAALALQPPPGVAPTPPAAGEPPPAARRRRPPRPARSRGC